MPSNMCIIVFMDMCMDKCRDMCTDMCTDMGADMYAQQPRLVIEDSMLAVPAAKRAKTTMLVGHGRV